MIVLDTHIWVWYVQGDQRLSNDACQIILANESDGIGVSAFSLWEVAKIVEKRKLELKVDLDAWFETALEYPGIRILPLTPQIAVESTNLPGDFHADPADQVIVATARIYDAPLATFDSKILNYPFVKRLSLQ